MFKGSVSRLRFRQLEDLFHTGIAGDLSDNELLDRFLHAGTQSEKPRSRRWSNGTARWSFVCAGRCSRITTPPRTPCRRRFWSWRGRLARFANEHPSRAGCSEWRRRAAARIRMEEARRRRYELRVFERSSALISAQQEPPDSEPYAELHAEIERLPEKYRFPVVLCYFEGLTHEQAASRLRWPLGTVKIRLSRARERLRSRLEARGRPSSLLLPAITHQPGTLAELPEQLINTITAAGCRYSTTGVTGGLVSSVVIKATQGVMQSMLIYKLKLAGAVLCGLFLFGFGVWSRLSRRRERAQMVKPLRR